MFANPWHEKNVLWGVNNRWIDTPTACDTACHNNEIVREKTEQENDASQFRRWSAGLAQQEKPYYTRIPKLHLTGVGRTELFNLNMAIMLN